jgi:phospholipid/cholesterol/gamma-HCH transport system ATP-binding protein
MIEVKNLSKSFEDKQVLKDINIVFDQGKTNLIIGQSGSGKTVLLKSIVGLHDINEGEVIFDGTIFNLLNFKEKKEMRKEIGMLFQGGALFDSSTVEENVMFPLDMFTEMSFEEKRARANECLKRVNIINANDLYPAEISGGMKKRVAIAEL